MSKVPIVIDIDRYICTELEDMRGMLKSHDYSMLPAAIERVQHHASAMEDGLHEAGTVRRVAKRLIKKKKVSDKEFRKRIKEALKGEETWS